MVAAYQLQTNPTPAMAPILAPAQQYNKSAFVIYIYLYGTMLLPEPEPGPSINHSYGSA